MDEIRNYFIGRSHYTSGPLSDEMLEIYQSLRSFFDDKCWYCGGRIPDDLLYNERNFHLLRNVAITEAVDMGFPAIHRSKKLAKTRYFKGCDTQIILKVIKECHYKAIPRKHIAGLFLSYLELCEKVELL